MRPTVFQYILDHVDPKSYIVLEVSDCKIHYDSKTGTFRVVKALSEQTFRLDNPECAQQIVAYIGEYEDEAIYLQMDDHMRVIGETALKTIVASTEITLLEKLDAIYDQSKRRNSITDDMIDYYVDDVGEFIDEVKTNYRGH